MACNRPGLFCPLLIEGRAKNCKICQWYNQPEKKTRASKIIAKQQLTLDAPLLQDRTRNKIQR